MKHAARTRLMRSDLRRAFSLRFWLLIPLVPALILLDNASDLLFLGQAPELTCFYFYDNSMVFGGVFGPTLMSMLCVIPFAWAAQEEIGAGYAPHLAQRAGVPAYCASKFLSGLLSGGVLNMLGVGLFFLIMRTMTAPVDEGSLSYLKDIPYAHFITLDSILVYALIASFFGFLRGVLWSGISMTVSLRTSSVSAVYLTPFVGLFLWREVSKTLVIPNEIRPDRWLDTASLACGSEVGGMLGSALFVACVSAVCFRLFLRKGRSLLEA